MLRTWICTAALLLGASLDRSPPADERPNILFCIADDWGWPHAGIYGDAVVATPTFDRIAREGVLFERAFVSSPSCTPSRNAILTGQLHWRLAAGANLHSELRAGFPVYPLLLEDAGYHVGHWRKAFGPGRVAKEWGERHPAGARYEGFEPFLAARPEGAPFCFWLGTTDPHRPYELGAGAKAGLKVDAVHVPAFLPDLPKVRGDIADYYLEVQRFDRDVGLVLARIEELGELENTLVVVTGDHGMPFPRCKSNLYDMGVRVPLAVRWGKSVPGARRVMDFVSLTDLAPTFLEAAGLDVPGVMTGRSLLALLRSEAQGRVEPARDHVIFGKERHTPAQAAPSLDGYPCRAIRTDRWLYIENLFPDRWPAGVPSGSTRGPGFSDCDDGPTKDLLVALEGDEHGGRFFDLAFARRPGAELYDVAADPFQLSNLAAEGGHAKVRAELARRLRESLERTGDPRVTGGGEAFDTYPYFGRMEKD